MDKIFSSETNIFLDYWMEKNAIIAIELDLLTSNIKRNICNVLDAFFSFLSKFDERKAHDMFTLMLDLKYKNLKYFLLKFVGKELGVGVVEEYDKIKTFFRMLLKTHQILHPLVTFEYMVERARDENLNLDIFEMTSKTNERSKKFVRWKVDLFKRYFDIKDITCPLDGWAKHESMFLVVAFLANQILGIVGS